MNLQIHFARKINKFSLKFADIDLCNSDVNFFGTKLANAKKRFHASRICLIIRSIMVVKSSDAFEKPLFISNLVENDFQKINLDV